MLNPGASELTRTLAKKFRASAEHIANNPCPEDIDPELWNAQREACLSMAEDLEQQLRDVGEEV